MTERALRLPLTPVRLSWSGWGEQMGSKLLSSVRLNLMSPVHPPHPCKTEVFGASLLINLKRSCVSSLVRMRQVVFPGEIQRFYH
jgi:hypothetical protein